MYLKLELQDIVMDALKCYESNSDTEEELIADPKVKYENTKEILSMLPNNSKDIKSVNDLKCDFFNLDDSECESESEPKSKQRKMDKTITLHEGETLTVPESNFWEPLASEIKESNFESVNHSVGHSDKKDLTFTFDYNSVNQSYSNYSKRHFKNVDLKKSQNNSTKDLTNFCYTRKNTDDCPKHLMNRDEFNCFCNSDSSKNSNQKLFEVHGKIKSWTNRQNINYKIPRECEKSWKAHDGAISKIKWNVAKYSHLLLSVSMDTTVRIWNVWNNLEMAVRLLRVHSKGIQDGDWSNSGNQILTCSYDKSAVISDVETGHPITRHNHKNFVTCGKFHPTNENIFLTGSLDELISWDTRQNNEPIHVYTYKDKMGQIQDVIFNRDGKEFFSTGDLVSRDSSDRNIMAWDFDHTVVKSNQIYQERYSCTCLKLHPTDSNFLAQSHGNYIACFSANKPYKMCRSLRYEGHKVEGYKVGFDISPDGRYVISGDAEGNFYNYDYKTGHLIRKLNTKLDVNLDVAFHPLLPSTVACCGWNGFIEMWH